MEVLARYPNRSAGPIAIPTAANTGADRCRGLVLCEYHIDTIGSSSLRAAMTT